MQRARCTSFSLTSRPMSSFIAFTAFHSTPSDFLLLPDHLPTQRSAQLASHAPPLARFPARSCCGARPSASCAAQLLRRGSFVLIRMESPGLRASAFQSTPLVRKRVAEKGHSVAQIPEVRSLTASAFPPDCRPPCAAGKILALPHTTQQKKVTARSVLV